MPENNRHEEISFDLRGLFDDLSQKWPIKIVRIAFMPPGDLLKYLNKANPRDHGEFQREVFDEIATKHGLLQFFILNDRTKRFIDGHMRVEEAHRKGISLVPTVWVDVPPEEEGEVLAKLDASGDLAVINPAKMLKLLDSIAEQGGRTEEFLESLEYKLTEPPIGESSLDFGGGFGGDEPAMGEIDGLDTGSGKKKKGELVKIPLGPDDYEEFVGFMKRIGKGTALKPGALVMIIPPRS